MANIKQQRKRVLQDNKLRSKNRMFKGSLKKAIKMVEANVESGDKEAAEQNLSLVYKKLDKALAKGLFHKNNIARKKSRLSKLVNSL